MIQKSRSINIVHFYRFTKILNEKITNVEKFSVKAICVVYDERGCLEKRTLSFLQANQNVSNLINVMIELRRWCMFISILHFIMTRILYFIEITHKSPMII